MPQLAIVNVNVAADGENTFITKAFLLNLDVTFSFIIGIKYCRSKVICFRCSVITKEMFFLFFFTVISM